MTPDPTALEAYVDVTAQTLGLPIDPASRALVIQNLAGLMQAARIVAEFELPAALEAAPVFRP
ncbi:MAG: DUF4089 domain-containing protein [Candidatus Rokubacteria bacterium]|nr:DUF4089 domain-containing protein [Candidatus Rokubacteria bacterium]